MSDPHPESPDPAQASSSVPSRMPTWVKVFVGIGIALLVLVLVVLLLGGGPGKHGPGRHVGSPSPDAEGIGQPSDPSAATRSIQLAAFDNMTFAPNTGALSAGETVTFVVTNRGQVAHEFVLGDEALPQQQARMRAHLGSQIAHDAPNGVHLAPGATGQLTWRFGNADLEYACHEPGHYDAGMVDAIAIA
jgi:uncharacterized cupredoxin-like copper-binding protein